MSATRDKNQKSTFMYSNLYALYRKGKDAAHSASVPSASPSASPSESEHDAQKDASNYFAKTSGKVLKAENLKDHVVEPFRPTEFLEKRLTPPPAPVAVLKAAPAPMDYGHKPIKAHQAQAEALNSLKSNLKNLNDLHSRLRFMLQELEDLVKE